MCLWKEMESNKNIISIEALLIYSPLELIFTWAIMLLAGVTFIVPTVVGGF